MSSFYSLSIHCFFLASYFTINFSVHLFLFIRFDSPYSFSFGLDNCTLLTSSSYHLFITFRTTWAAYKNNNHRSDCPYLQYTVNLSTDFNFSYKGSISQSKTRSHVCTPLCFKLSLKSSMCILSGSPCLTIE